MSTPAKKRGEPEEKAEHIDEEHILLRPDRKEGEMAVFNPSVCQDGENFPLPILYRAVMNDGRSIIKCGQLLTPKKLSNKSRVLIFPEYDYELRGCEDPRISKVGDTYFIIYTAYDGVNARIGLAQTKDFGKVKKLGVIGPEILLEEAVELVQDESYLQRWRKHLPDSEKKARELGLGALLWDKDASIHYKNGKWILIHRIEPHMHIAVANSLKDFQEKEFWKDYLKNINKYELIRVDKLTNGRRIEKIGLGSPLFNLGDRLVGTYHGVSRENGILDYSGNFFEFDMGELKVRSLLRDPLFEPHSEDYVLREYDDKGKIRRTKRVAFPSGIIRDPDKEDTLWAHLGIGDNCIGSRSTGLVWLCGELDKPENAYS